MNYAKINTTDIANGPGVRVSLFVSGCRRHCPGCHNSQAWDFGYGELFTADTAYQIIELMRSEYITGITILGGEPFEPENAICISNLLYEIDEAYGDSKNVWVYTGYTYEEIISAGRRNSSIANLLWNADVLVDGPYIEAERDITLKFRGSRNQRIIDLPKSLSTGGIVLYEV